MSLTLSSDQSSAIAGIMKTLFSVNKKQPAFAVLTGPAGTGKTTVMKVLLDTIKQQDSRQLIELTATTHRAAWVMGNATGRTVKTVHTLFALRPSVDRFGNESFVKSGKCKIPYGAVVVVDEASMAGNKFLKAIVPTIKELALKMVFVGDPYQLPPTKDVCSLFDGSMPTFRLTQVHRQAGGNPILDLATEYRKYIDGTRDTEPTIQTDVTATGEGIHVLKHSDFVEKFVQRYVNYTAGTDVSAPMCTYTNDSAINYNGLIRNASYFLNGTVEPFYPGERLISNSMVKHDNRIILANNESVLVDRYEGAEFMGISGYTVDVTGAWSKYTGTDRKRVFVPLSPAAAKPILDELKKTAVRNRTKHDWAAYYDVLQALADLRPPFAGTTHKAQGGTYESVFIDRTNIEKCKDPMVKARLMYVALTRATKDAYINT